MLDGVTRFNTIDVPITLTYDYKNFVFEAGAYISYLLGAKQIQSNRKIFLF